MKFLKQWLLAAAALALAPATLAQVTVSGVKYDETADVRGTKLQLNGAGVRYKAVFKVYTAGLYLTKNAGSTEEVLAAPGAKRMSITMLREIDSTELGKLFSRGMEDNMDKAAFSKLIPGVMRMSQIFSDHKKLKPGDTFTHRLGSRHRHRHQRQGRAAGRAVQGAGVLQRAAAHLAGP